MRHDAPDRDTTLLHVLLLLLINNTLASVAKTESVVVVVTEYFHYFSRGKYITGSTLNSPTSALTMVSPLRNL